MKTAMTALLLSASLLAACDSAPTSPDARGTRSQAKPADVLLFGPSWSATTLPFRPMAMNDAGVIVGVQAQANGSLAAVMWQNGVTKLLVIPQGIENHCVGNSMATAISPSGIIAGNIGGCLTEWASGGVQTLYLTFPGSISYTPLAVYDNGTMLGSARSLSGTPYAFQIVTGTGFSGLSAAGFSASGVDGQGNVYGSANGLPVRWSQRFGTSGMSVLSGYTGGGVLAADPAGDALGTLHDGYGNVVPIKWSANGSVTTLAGLPANPSYLNAAGRIVGYARFSATTQAQIWTSINGALTVLTSPDAQPYTAMGVNSCGSIIAASGFSLTGVVFRRTSITGPVCDQPPVALLADKVSARGAMSR